MTVAHTSRISQHTIVEANQAQKKNLGWKWTPGTSPVGGGTVGTRRTEKIKKEKIIGRRALTQPWETSSFRDRRNDMAAIKDGEVSGRNDGAVNQVSCYREKTKINASQFGNENH